MTAYWLCLMSLMLNLISKGSKKEWTNKSKNNKNIFLL